MQSWLVTQSSFVFVFSVEVRYFARPQTQEFIWQGQKLPATHKSIMDGTWWMVGLGFSAKFPQPNECMYLFALFNSLRPRQNGRHFANDTFNRFIQNENVWISIKISLKFVPKAPINNIPSLDQIMAWRLPGDKPLSEPMMVSLLTHICVTRPQRVNMQITR